MKKKLLIAALLTSCLFGCSKAPKQEGLFFFNDMESINGWGAWGLTTENKYSGEYALKMDSVQMYSYGFKIKFKDISKKPVKRVKYSVYCMYTNPNAKASVVFAVDGVDKPNIFWNGIPVQDQIREVNKWQMITGEVDFTKGNLNAWDNTVAMYVWNNSKEIIFADDFELEFIE